METKLMISVVDGYDYIEYFDFSVPTDKLAEYLKQYNVTVEDFLEEYNSIDAKEIYEYFVSNEIIEENKEYEQYVERLYDKDDEFGYV